MPPSQAKLRKGAEAKDTTGNPAAGAQPGNHLTTPAPPT